MVGGIFELYVSRWDFFSELIYQHIMITFIAVAIISVIGLTLGVLMTQNSKLASVVLVVTNFIYTIPAIALFGMLVTVTGIGDKSAIIALTLYGILPIVRNVYTGIMEVDDQIIESAIGMGVTKKQLMLKIQLPLASPVIMAGFRTMVVMTIALGGIASFIGAGGLGKAIYRGITTYYPEMIIGGSLLVALLAIITDFFLGIIERRIRIKVLGRSSTGGKK